MFNKVIKDIAYKDINELLYIRQEKEGQRLDYKREFHKDGKEFAKDTTAFANADGGYIIFGIDEKQKIVIGLSDNVGNGKFEDWIANVLNTNIDKPLNYETKFINIAEENIPLFIVVVQIKESNQKPIYVTADNKSICYIRKGTSVFSAKPDEIREMYLETLKNAEQSQIKVTQKSKGNHNLQVGVNQGTIIKTDKLVRRNEVAPNPDIHISQEQAKQIYDIVNKIVEINEQAGKFNDPKDKGRFFLQTWTSLKNRYHITSYHLLPKEKFDDTLIWLQKQIAFDHRPKLRKGNNPQWKKDIYGAIYAKAKNDLHFDNEELYLFAFDKLKLKKPIASLKDLSDTRLNKLYKIIFAK
ncbi:MAG: ATP-binding protein [Chlorobium sp.]|uniref:AlbA family DNA-binding domain-containing protein n=1 Tax=Chlorobium sp. TaxID=1095 RepID=UPI0025C2E735|nr:ATP-binding protein [Chlorobium sp.]MCF8383726.1 ATP-binding protein [Chlorobium sp.]